MKVNDERFFKNRGGSNDQIILELLVVYNYEHYNNDLTLYFKQ